MPRRRWVEPEALAPLDLRLALPALALWAGCLVGLWWPSGSWPLIIAGVVTGVLGFHRVRHTTAGMRVVAASRVAGVLLICVIVGIGVATLQRVAAETDPLTVTGDAGGWARVEMVVSAVPKPLAARFPARESTPSVAGADPRDDASRQWRVTGRSRTVDTNGTGQRSSVAVTVFGTGPQWRTVVPGQRIALAGVIRPDPFAAVAGVTVRAAGPPEVLAGPPWWRGWAAPARSGLMRAAEVLDDERTGLLLGVVVSDRSGLDPRLDADTKATGLTHLMAVSGTHVAIAAGMVLVLLRRFGPWIAGGGTATVLVGMVILVGPAPSVLRATLMAAIGIFAAIVGRGRSALPALAAAVIVLLLIDPAHAVSPAFALSVQATAGLVLLAPPWQRALRRRGLPPGAAAALAVPVAAHVVTLPVIAAISGSISLAAIPANILVAPIVAPALLLGQAALLLGWWWPGLARLVVQVDGPLLGWIAGVAHHLARWPAATVPWPATPGAVVGLAVVTVLVLLGVRQRGFRRIAAAIVIGVLVALVPFRLWASGWPGRGWLITACEVGQGDGMVVSTGVEGTVVVIDVGPDPDAMVGCLDRLGVRRVGLVVLSHPHADHIDGLSGVLARWPVDGIVTGPTADPDLWHHVVEQAAGAGVPIGEVTPGMRWGAGDLELEVLAPAAPLRGTGADTNNNSLVLRVERAGLVALFTGDIELDAQRALLRAVPDLRADILKQPHHGSAQILPEFMEAVAPGVVLIGVGADNGYGHPSATALRLADRAGAIRVLRTDRDGDAQVALGPAGMTVLVRGPSRTAGGR